MDIPRGTRWVELFLDKGGYCDNCPELQSLLVHDLHQHYTKVLKYMTDEQREHEREQLLTFFGWALNATLLPESTVIIRPPDTGDYQHWIFIQGQFTKHGLPMSVFHLKPHVPYYLRLRDHLLTKDVGDLKSLYQQAIDNVKLLEYGPVVLLHEKFSLCMYLTKKPFSLVQIHRQTRDRKLLAYIFPFMDEVLDEVATSSGLSVVLGKEASFDNINCLSPSDLHRVML